MDAGASPTRASLFRTIDTFRGTLIIDEADCQDDLRSAFIKLFNVGYRRDGSVMLCVSSEEKWEPETFKVGGPKIIASRFALNDDALESRCLTIHTAFRRHDPRIPSHLPNDHKSESECLRNQLLKWRLTNLGSIGSLESEMCGLDGRSLEIGLPIYSLSPDVSFKKEFLTYLKRRTQILREADPVRIVLTSIAQACHGGKSRVLAKNISLAATLIGQEQDVAKDFFSCKRVAAIARSLGIRTGKSGAGVVLLVNDRQLKTLTERFGIGSDDRDGDDASDELDTRSEPTTAVAY
jgi:hypothetical protein